jgi:hypothetical protein
MLGMLRFGAPVRQSLFMYAEYADHQVRDKSSGNHRNLSHPGCCASSPSTPPWSPSPLCPPPSLSTPLCPPLSPILTMMMIIIIIIAELHESQCALLRLLGIGFCHGRHWLHRNWHLLRKAASHPKSMCARVALALALALALSLVHGCCQFAGHPAHRRGFTRTHQHRHRCK